MTASLPINHMPVIDSITILQSILDAHGSTLQSVSVTVCHLSSIGFCNKTDCFLIRARQK